MNSLKAMIQSRLYPVCRSFKRSRHISFALYAFSTQKKEGYQSIGSFHSDNPEELIRLHDSEYVAPELPFSATRQEVLNASSSSQEPFANASSHQKAYPHLDRKNWTFLNHGAFGLALSCGLQRAHSWNNFLESQPLRYFDRYLLNHLVHSARSMVDFCSDASVRDEECKLRLRESVALIPNVTSGMNAALGGHARCNKYKSKVFYYDIGYGSNKKMCQMYHGENAIVIPFEDEYLPQLRRVDGTSREENDWNAASADVFIQAFDATIQNRAAKGQVSEDTLSGSLLILDHISSNTAIHTPISAIAKYVKEEYGMLVVVDGAHGLLGLNLDMCKILTSGNRSDNCFSGYVDVYLTNAHKWFSSPRGAAVMFCANPSIRETILRQPAVVSHGVDDGYLSRFLWDGCRDYGAQLSLPVIKEHWDSIGCDIAHKQMETNLSAGIGVLLSKWHPEVCNGGDDILEHSADVGLTLVSLGLHAPMMALVQLPMDISGGNQLVGKQMTSTDAKRVQDFLYSQHVEVPVKCVGGVLYVRVSCHVYNTPQEFECLADAMLRYRN